MNVFDWLSDMTEGNTLTYSKVEVRFKNGRKGYFKNEEKLVLKVGDVVAVES